MTVIRRGAALLAVAAALQFCAQHTSQSGLDCRARLKADHPRTTWLTDSGVVADLTGDSVPELAIWGKDSASIIVAIAECPSGRARRTWALQFPPTCGSLDADVGLETPSFSLEARGCENEPQPEEGENCLQARQFAQRLHALAQTGARGLAVGSGDCDDFHVFWDAAHQSFESWRV